MIEELDEKRRKLERVFKNGKGEENRFFMAKYNQI